jgi:hypothetical protein
MIDVAQSSIGIGVRKDGPKPDISSADKFKQALLAARAFSSRAESGWDSLLVQCVIHRLPA